MKPAKPLNHYISEEEIDHLENWIGPQFNESELDWSYGADLDEFFKKQVDGK